MFKARVIGDLFVSVGGLFEQRVVDVLTPGVPAVVDIRAAEMSEAAGAAEPTWAMRADLHAYRGLD